MNELVNIYINNIIEEKFEFIVESGFLPIVTDTGIYKVIKFHIEDECLDLHKLHQTIEELFVREKIGFINIGKTLSSIEFAEYILSTGIDRVDRINLGDQYTIKNSSPEIDISVDVRISNLSEDLFMTSSLFDIKGTFLIGRTYSSPYEKLADKYLGETFSKYLGFIHKFNVLPIFGTDYIQPINYIVDLDGRDKSIQDVDFVKYVRSIFRFLGLKEISNDNIKRYVDYVNSTLNFIPDRESIYNFIITFKNKQEKVEGNTKGFGLFRHLSSWYNDNSIQRITIISTHMLY